MSISEDNITDNRKQKWNKDYFEDVSLQDIGLWVQMGHKFDTRCKAPIAAHVNLVVIHTNGLHDVAIDYCGCQQPSVVGDEWQQLMRKDWYPGSAEEPQTCCTFEVLRLFHLMTLQGKMSTYDFYAALERRTDNTGLRALKVCLSIFT